jgi:hypothetical protein
MGHGSVLIENAIEYCLGVRVDTDLDDTVSVSLLHLRYSLLHADADVCSPAMRRLGCMG